MVHRVDARIKLAALALFSIVSLQAGFSALILALVAALVLLAAAGWSPLRLPAESEMVSGPAAVHRRRQGPDDAG